MEEIPIKFLILAILIFAGTLIWVGINLAMYKVQDSIQSHVFHYIGRTLSYNIEPYEYYGFCGDVSTLLAATYLLVYNEPVYYVIFPTKRHSGLIIGDTLYTTADLTSPIKIVYKCRLDSRFYKTVRTMNLSKIRDILVEYLNTNRDLVRCEIVFGKDYKEIVLFGGIVVYPLDKLYEIAKDRKKEEFIKSLLRG